MAPDDAQEVALLVVRCDAVTAAWAPPGFALPDGYAERELGIWREDVGTERFRAELACEADGTIVGVVATDGPSHDDRPASGHVTSLFVEPRLHGQRLGSALLARAETWLREDGCDRATLNVLEGSPAVRLYERHGWTPSGNRGRYEPFDMPTVGYRKNL